MRTTRKNHLTFVFVVMLLAMLACSVGGGTAIDISGSYNVSGTNQDGSAYDGTATITSTEGNNYNITWNIADSIITGTGTLDGDVFTVDDGTFINTYTVQSNGDLDGTWTQRDFEGTGTEYLTRR